MHSSMVRTILFIAAAFAILIGVCVVYPQHSESVVAIEVSIPAIADVEAVKAEIRYAGEITELALLKHPVSDALSSWTCTWEPDTPLLILPIRILVMRRGNDCFEDAGTHFEVLCTGRNHLTWYLESKNGFTTTRLPCRGTVEHALSLERLWIIAKSAVAIVTLLVVFWMLRHMAYETHKDDTIDMSSRGRCRVQSMLDIVLWVVLAAAWTWPAIRAGNHSVVGRHFDTLGTVWAIDAASRILSGLRDVETSWPLIADYRHIDSFVLLPVSALFRRIDAVRLHGLFQVAGVAASAWAAQGFARAIGARRPWDMLAGLSFAFSGLSAYALLEGHVYHVMNPFLPLFAWAWWRAMFDRRRFVSGIYAGGLFVLSLLTSAYIGVAALVVAVTFFLSGMLKYGRLVSKPALGALAVTIPVVLLYAAQFCNAPELNRRMTEGSVLMNSMHLVSMIGATPEVDRSGHSLAAELMPLVLALVIAAPLLLRGRWEYRVLMSTAVAGFLLAVGPFFGASAAHTLVRTPLALLVDSPLAVMFRFSLRYVSVWNLCAGALAGLAASKLAGRLGKSVWLLMLLALLHPFVMIRLPGRQMVRCWTTPDVYFSEAGPVLDLFPSKEQQRCPLESPWFSGLACMYQLDHHRPLADNCIETIGPNIPRAMLGKWAIQQLLAGQADAVKRNLANLGFTTIVLHSDYFLSDHVDRVDDALATFGTRRSVSTNAGVCLVSQQIPPPETELQFSERIALYDRLLAGLSKRKRPIEAKASNVAAGCLQNTSNDQAALAGSSIYLVIVLALYLQHWKFKRNDSTHT